jgi:hypothetical protein
MGTLFDPIDWNAKDAQTEYDKRKSINASIDFLGQLSQANQGNDNLQNVLMKQYLGLVYPEQLSTTDQASQNMDQLGLATKLMGTGNSTYDSIANGIFQSNPLTKQYMPTGAQITSSNPFAGLNQNQSTLLDQVTTAQKQKPSYDTMMQMLNNPEQDNPIMKERVDLLNQFMNAKGTSGLAQKYGITQ